MKPGNGNPATPQYRLKIFIQSIAEPFFYEVAESEMERVKAFFAKQKETRPHSSKKRFIVFETIDQQLHVLIAAPYVQFVHFLWDPSIAEIQLPVILREGNLTMYLNGRNEPFDSSFDDPVEALQLVAGLDSEQGFFGTFHLFDDVDGECVCVRIDQIMLLEISSDVVREGMEKIAKPE